jgi:PAS domain S-box-containing protein
MSGQSTERVHQETAAERLMFGPSHMGAAFQAIIEAFPDVYLVLSGEGVVLEYYARREAQSDPAPEQVVGQGVVEVVPGPAGLALRERVRQVARLGRVDRLEYRLPGAVGEQYFEARLAPLPEGRVLAVVRDVSELRRAERALRESELRYRRIIETAEEGVWMLDAEGRTIFANDKMARMLGYTVEEMQGQMLFDFMEEEARQSAMQYLERRRQGVSEQHDFRFQRKDGTDVWTLISTNPVMDEEGNFLGVLGMITDITDRVRAAQEREALLEQAQEAVRTRDEFLSIASHELRTPLASLQLVVQSFKRSVQGDPTPERLGRALETVERQVRRLSRLVEQLLDVSRITAGRFELSVGPVDLGEVTREALSGLRGELERAGCTATLEEPAGRVITLGDRGRLEQVLTNLLSNALRYGAGKPIQVRVGEQHGHALVEVKDEGIGIPHEDQQRIFRRFERGAASRDYGGLGLGLYIVSRILQAHGGHISVRSQPGQGSTFCVTLPLARLGIGG